MKEKKFAITIRLRLDHLSAAAPTNISHGTNVNERAARTPAMARGEPPEASPARMNMAMIVNQSKVYSKHEVSQSLLKAGFLLKSSM